MVHVVPLCHQSSNSMHPVSLSCDLGDIRARSLISIANTDMDTSADSVYNITLPVDALSVFKYPACAAVFNLPSGLDYDDPHVASQFRTAYRRMKKAWHPDKLVNSHVDQSISNTVSVALDTCKLILLREGDLLESEYRGFLNCLDKAKLDRRFHWKDSRRRDAAVDKAYDID